jgi:hypothetical protein
MAVFEQAMQTEGAAEAMRHEGVRPETMVAQRRGEGAAGGLGAGGGDRGGEHSVSGATPVRRLARRRPPPKVRRLGTRLRGHLARQGP